MCRSLEEPEGFRFEDDHHDAVYKAAVYRDGGLVLWSQTVEGADSAIRLRGTTKDRQEGGISVVLLAGSACLNEMSYAWVDSALINGRGGINPFI